MTRSDLSFLLVDGASWWDAIPPPADEPVRDGQGPLECSSCTALQPILTVIWDANGYYRELGVDPRCSRRDLQRAYTRLRGWESLRLTYVFRQLRDPVIRRAYDATPLGRPFIDEYVSESLKRAAHQESGRRTAMGVRDTPQKVMDEWGLSLDADPAEGFNQGPPESQWTFSFFIWKTWSPDTTLQTMVITSLAEMGVVARFAVGVRGDYQGILVALEDDGTIIAFLGEHTRLTHEMADSAAQRITELHTHTRHS